MKFSKWIYNLGFEEYLVIFTLFMFSAFLSFQFIKLMNALNKNLNREKKFSKEFRASPLPLFGLSVILASLLYLAVGDFFVESIKEIFN